MTERNACIDVPVRRKEEFMKGKSAGKVKEVALKRSVLKELSPVLCKNPERPQVGADATGFCIDCAGTLLTSVATMEGRTESMVLSTIHRALNNLYIKKVRPIGITISLMLRYGGSEADVKKIMRAITAVCIEHQICVLGGETTRSASATDHVLTIQAMGMKASEDREHTPIAGQSIVMSGMAGMAGTLRIYEKQREALNERFSQYFLSDIETYRKLLSVRTQCEIANDVSYAHDVSEGGIFSALWELGEYLKCGMRIQLPSVLLSQNTIELCEVFDLNPYLLFSLGCAVFVTEDGEALTERFREAGIPAAVIGTLTENADRILDNGEEIRYLEPYRADDIYKL